MPTAVAPPMRHLPRHLARGCTQHIRNIRCNHVLPAAAQSDKSLLYLSPVWPEPSSSAAGVRTAELVTAWQAAGYAVHFVCTAAESEHSARLRQSGAATYQCPANREEQLADIVRAARPTVACFDRFYTEEAFSFRVRELAPSALRVLDMQDVHFLRAGRQQLARRGVSMADVMACRPDTDDVACLRELASIHRSDLTLVCSPVERAMLAEHYGVPPGKLQLAPLFMPPSPYDPSRSSHTGPAEASPSFEERRHFCMLGNFRHAPNLDAARWAAAELWPPLRRALAAGGHRAVELHVYGAYPSGGVEALHQPSQGIHVKGWAPDLAEALLRYRVNFAPLRFGAGLKGKVADSWWHGLPVCTTPVGAEGMALGNAGLAPASRGCLTGAVDAAAEWGGVCAAGDSPEGLVVAAARLYTDAELWRGAQARGFQLLRLLYGRDERLAAVVNAVEAAAAELRARRAGDFVGQLLWQQHLRSTEFFSRWIELKETGQPGRAVEPSG